MAESTATDLIEPTPTNRTALAAVTFERRGVGGGIALIPQNFDQVVLMAQMMAKAGGAVPKHMRDNPGVCMAVIVRAVGWEMDPFAVATKTYFVNDQVAYESQLVSAVVNMRAPVKGRPKVRYEGEGPERKCIFGYTMDDGEFLEYESPRIKDIKVKNSPLWTADPDQQLFYYSARAWARRWVPEVLMGVYTPDEVVLQAQEDADRPRTFEALEERAAAAQDAEFEDKAVATAEPPKDAAKPRQRSKKPEEPADVPQQPAGGAAATSDQADAASPASANGTAMAAGSPGSGEPTTKTSLKASADGSYTVTVSFAEPGGFADPDELYMIGRAIEKDGAWEGDVQRTPTGDLLFWRDERPVQGITKANAPKRVWAYSQHAERPTVVPSTESGDAVSETTPERPTQTASAPAAEAGPDSPASATAASEASPAATSGPTADPGADERDPFAAFADVLVDAQDWPQTIAPAIAALRLTPAWTGASEDMKVRVHTMAFHRLQELIAGGYRFDFLDDLHAYRCYIDQEWNADALDGNHRVMERSKPWLDLSTPGKNAFDKAIQAQKARIAGLPGAGAQFA